MESKHSPNASKSPIDGKPNIEGISQFQSNITGRAKNIDMIRPTKTIAIRKTTTVAVIVLIIFSPIDQDLSKVPYFLLELAYLSLVLPYMC